SGLYFRGKIAYARAFAPDETFVITPTRGLQRPGLIVTADLIREFAGVDISEGDARYRTPLVRDVRALPTRITADARVVLFGSNLRECCERLSGRARSAADLHTVLRFAEEILEQPMELIEGVPETLAYLAGRHELTLFTKGHPEEQKLKVDRSGLAVYFGAT